MSHSPGCGVRRVVKPQRRYIPSRKEQDDERSGLLSKMIVFYTEASKRLDVRARPATAARFLDSGLCIGLLDPISNIMVNTVCTSDLRPDPEAVVLDGTVVAEKIDELGRRSMEGLAAFLIYFFPYLAKWEAVRYLLLADADLIAAAYLIVTERGMTLFSPSSPVTALSLEEALTLAAQVAKHSQPCQLTQLWMSLSSGLHQVMFMLLEVQSQPLCRNLEAFKIWREWYEAPTDLNIAWDLGASRLHHCNNNFAKSMLYEHTQSLRMLLLNTIHGFYLKALAMLPSGELRSRLHRSLLKAGHCYGPMDPVSNIILNTIWYDANFPAAADTIPVLDVIGPNSLARLVSRSFYGLVSFLQTHYHELSQHQIVRCLVAASAQLSIADPKLKLPSDEKHFEQDHYHCCLEDVSGLFGDAIRKIEEASPCADVLEAYAAAATAAWHSHPEEQAKFLTSWNKRGFARGSIDLTDVQHWSLLLFEVEQRAPERVCNSSHRARLGKARSMNLQKRICRKVKAALDRDMLQDGKPTLDLHIICCVNENVCGPEDGANIDPLAFSPYKYRYSHVNFMAIERKHESDATLCPILFFAEFDNDEEDGAPLVMCRVDPPTSFAEHVRCLYCEVEGARVVHPAWPRFHGGGNELAEVIRGEKYLNNDRLICRSEYCAQCILGVDEDFMYVDVNNNE